MKFLPLFISLTLLSTNVKAQQAFTYEDMEKADTGWSASYLTLEERNVIKLMNLARMDGKRFFESYIKKYVIERNEAYATIDTTNTYYKSLKQDLYKVKNLPMLSPDRGLYEAAAYHASDMGKSGETGHKSTDGTSFHDRLEKFTGQKYGVSEACSYGHSKAMGIVFLLLHDEGVESLGHRKSILDQWSNTTGVAIRNHKKYGYNCVIDFSDQLVKQPNKYAK